MRKWGSGRRGRWRSRCEGCWAGERLGGNYALFGPGTGLLAEANVQFPIYLLDCSHRGPSSHSLHLEHTEVSIATSDGEKFSHQLPV